MDRKNVEKIIKHIVWMINLIALCCFTVKVFDFDYTDLRWFCCINWIISGIVYKRVGLDVKAVLLFGAATIYAIVYKSYFEVPDHWVYGTALSPGLAYVWGRLILGNTARRQLEDRITIVLWLIVLGMLVHGVLNARIYFEEAFGDRYWNDYWTGKIMPATQHVFFFVPIVSMTVAAFAMKWWKAILALGLVIGAVWKVSLMKNERRLIEAGKAVSAS